MYRYSLLTVPQKRIPDAHDDKPPWNVNFFSETVAEIFYLFSQQFCARPDKSMKRDYVDIFTRIRTYNIQLRIILQGNAMYTSTYTLTLSYIHAYISVCVLGYKRPS